MIDTLKKYLSEEKISDETVTDVTDALLKAKEDYDLRQQWETSIQRRRQQRRRRLALGILALAIALGLGAFFYLTNQAEEVSTIPYAQNYLETSRYPIGQFRGETDLSLNLLKAKEAYEQQDYQTAIRYFESVNEEASLRIEDRFYLGLAHLYGKDAAQALGVFESIEKEKTAYFQYATELNFFLGISHILLGQNESAKKYLEASKTSNWERTTIEALLEKIEASGKD